MPALCAINAGGAGFGSGRDGTTKAGHYVAQGLGAAGFGTSGRIDLKGAVGLAFKPNRGAVQS